MRSFIRKLLYFLIPLVSLTILGIFLPTTPKASTSHMFGKLKMDSLLKNVESPRLILIGGSNISLTINSQLLKDSLAVNPINTGISWTIGFAYMFDNTLKYVRPGDVIVASLEYDQFYNGAVYGGPDLARTIFDVCPQEFFKLRKQQYYNVLPHIPYYAFSKYKPNEYFFLGNPQEVYTRNATNKFGDNCRHWNLPGRRVLPLTPLPEKLDKYAFDLLSEFESAIEERGGILLVTFPCLQQESFIMQSVGIKAIENELKRRNFSLIGTPERYVMPDVLVFDTPYHLIKPGVDLRTNILIEDLKFASQSSSRRNILQQWRNLRR